MKTALIFGASGQMGSYLKELLTEKGYRLLCPTRAEVDFLTFTPWTMRMLLSGLQPDEIYNLAGLNYAPDSWINPWAYLQVNGYAVQQILEAMVTVCPKAKYFQASSAEIFDKGTLFQDETTNRLPENPYGLSKMLATDFVRVYRKKYDLFACTGIFFNAESPRRLHSFFAEKVAYEVVRLKREFNTGVLWQPIKLGSLAARRDWGWAPEYVEVVWQMLQGDRPTDIVIGTGETHTCFEFVQEALEVAGLPDVQKDFGRYVSWNPRPAPHTSTGDCMKAMPMKAKILYGWEARYKFKDVVRMLVEAEMKVGLGESTVAR